MGCAAVPVTGHGHLLRGLRSGTAHRRRADRAHPGGLAEATETVCQRHPARRQSPGWL